MNANHELERRLADFYATEAPQRAPDRVLEAILETSEITRQRRALIRLPWRFPNMNSFAKVAIAAVAVIAIGAVGLAVLRPGSSPGVGGPALTPSPEPSPSSSPSGDQPTDVVARPRSAADPELHLDAARVFPEVPERMDRSSGDRALDGQRISPLLPGDPCRPPVRPDPDQ